MPDSHAIWQLRQCGVPLIETRHSKQMPMPHNGPRGSPVTEVRHGCPAIAKATATETPAGTVNGAPFTINVIELACDSAMGNFPHGS
jgi:hypothetical protein